MSRNAHVTDYLNYYLRMQKPQFAVMLNGKWGCGKTFFINKYLKETYHDKKEYLKISLYGMSHVNQINEAFFTQLHPILNSKGMQLAAKLGKGFLKTTIKVDLDGSDKNNASATIQVPDLNIPEFLSNIGEKLLVFDDLERCNIPLDEAMGYINSFVEHDNQKVIILAHENEIPNHDKYLTIKEKLIGQTLTIESSEDEAIDFFIDEFPTSEIKTFYRNKREVIKTIYIQSETQNLRILRQNMQTFERFTKILTKEMWASKDSVSELMKLIFAVGFLLKGKGRYTIKTDRENRKTQSSFDKNDELSALMSPIFWALQKQGHEDLKQKCRKISNQFQSTQFDSKLLSSNILKDLFFDGSIDPIKTQEHLNNNHYFFKSENSPEWMTVWNLFSNSDEDIKTAINSMDKKLAETSYTHSGQILHVIGIRLKLATHGIIEETIEQVVNNSKTYIENLRGNNEFYIQNASHLPDNYRGFHKLNASYSLEFQSHETSEFKELKTILYNTIKAEKESHYPNEAKKLLTLVDTDYETFYEALCITNNGHNKYAHIPILLHINPIDYVEVLTTHKPTFQRNLFYIFKDRYRQDHLENILSLEGPWLQEVKKLLDEYLITCTPIAKYRLESNIQEYLDPTLEKLK